MSHARKFLDLAARVATLIPAEAVDSLAHSLARLRDGGGRLFVLGVGGSAGNAAHAVNDFRKLCGIEAYAPTDNVPELTARTNDEGWETVFSEWLRTSRLGPGDGVFVLSVGGGDPARSVSVNLVRAVDLARERGAAVLGVVGRDGGHARRVGGDGVIVVPTVDPGLVTPLAEAFQAVVWHCLVSHPALQTAATKW